MLHSRCRTGKIGYCRGGLGGGSNFCVADSKKRISEEYLDEKLTLQGLWPPGVEVQILVEVMRLPKVTAHSVLVMTVRST